MPLSFDDGFRPEFGVNMAACMGELGYEVSLGEDSSYEIHDVPAEQADSMARDRDECKLKFGYDQPPPEFTDAQLKLLYPHRLWEWKCLSEEGYGPMPPPSEQAFIDEWHTSGAMWTPYSQFTGSLPQEQQLELFEKCPRS